MRHLPVVLICITLSPAVFPAADPSCQPIIEADKARAAARQWHMRKTFAGSGMEVIRLGEDVYANMGGTGWKQMPPAMAKNVVNAGSQAEKFDVSACKKLGEETVGGVATTLYSFTTTVKGQPPFHGKVWVGNKDGRPYREQGDQYEGTTTYESVTAPELK